jgi:hypothetical protein
MIMLLPGFRRRNYTVCFTDLDQGSEIIIFESILTTFIASVFLAAPGAVANIGLSLKSNHYQ